MLQVICQIKDTKEHFVKLTWINRNLVSHIYILLPDTRIASMATSLLKTSEFMKEYCDIIEHNGAQVMHFKPHQIGCGGLAGLAETYDNKTLPAEQKSFYITFAWGEQALKAAIGLAKILDSNFPDNIGESNINWGDFWLRAEGVNGIYFDPKCCPTHFAPDTNAFLDEFIHPQEVVLDPRDARITELEHMLEEREATIERLMHENIELRGENAHYQSDFADA